MSEAEKQGRVEFHILLAAGACWGLSEAALGAWLKGVCNSGITGSLMTGAAIFFLAAAHRPGRNPLRLGVVPALAVALKLLDGLILRIPLSSPVILHPVYAMITEALCFILVVSILPIRMKASPRNRWGSGAVMGLASALTFIGVGFFTGSPACRIAGTSIPVSLAYAPLTMAFSAVAFAAGRSIEALLSKISPPRFLPRMLDSLSLLALGALVVIDLVIR